MKISNVLQILKAEKIFRRTPSGRSLTEFAVETVVASLEDEKNYDQNIFICVNCNLTTSSLLTTEGCPNCGLKQDLSTK